jgi:hypothetical protein
MRKSKSNPAKYTRNYRKVSQRHMTGYGDDEPSSTKKNTDEKERTRLESVLKNAEATWKRGLGQLNDIDESLMVGGKRKRGAQDPSKDEIVSDDKDDGMMSLLSPELREQFAGMESLVILSSSSKKKSKKKELPPLTPAEIKAAKALYKNTQRKLAQLEQRKKQKELRSGLYKELQENALLAPAAAENNADVDAREQIDPVAITNNITPQEAQSLLLKSSELGKRLSKKQKLKHIRQKEALGLKLTQEEKDLLYVKYDAPDDDDFPPVADASIDVKESVDDGGKKKKSKKKRKLAVAAADDDGNIAGCGKESEESIKAAPTKTKVEAAHKLSEDSAVDAKVGKSAAGLDDDNTNTKSSSKSEDGTATAKPSTASYAQMMLAGLSFLKSKTDTRNVELAEEKIRQQQEAEEEAMRLEEEERKKRKVYVPSETIKVSTMHRIDAPIREGSEPKSHRVQTVNRPKDVDESRYDLPVSAMEFEIIDAVRSNDCTILCGGKLAAYLM